MIVDKDKNIKTKYNISESFSSGLKKLGFDTEIDKNLYFVSAYEDYKKQLSDKHPVLLFHLEKAEKLGAKAVYFRNTFEGRGEPLAQLYIYDFTNSSYDKLIVYLREKVIKKFADSQNKEKRTLIHKLIVQSILIKYLNSIEIWISVIST